MYLDILFIIFLIGVLFYSVYCLIKLLLNRQTSFFNSILILLLIIGVFSSAIYLMVLTLKGVV